MGKKYLFFWYFLDFRTDPIRIQGRIHITARIIDKNNLYAISKSIVLPFVKKKYRDYIIQLRKYQTNEIKFLTFPLSMEVQCPGSGI